MTIQILLILIDLTANLLLLLIFDFLNLNNSGNRKDIKKW